MTRTHSRITCQQPHPKSQRCGFTILELLVTIGLIGVLVALLLPAVMQARGAARRTTCTNHLRQLGLATLNVAEQHGQMPCSGYFSRQGVGYHNWVVTLLPWIDQEAIHRKWDFELAFTDPNNLPLAQTHIPLVTCPDDITASGGGDLSYAVNQGVGWTYIGVKQPRGLIDLNGDGVIDFDAGTPTEAEMYHGMGLFLIDNWPVKSHLVHHHSLGDIIDGTSQTIMIADSVRAGVDPYGGDAGNWASPHPWRSTFIISGYVCQDLSCVPGNVDYSRANSREEPYVTEALNSAQKQAEGDAPWASSFHVGGLHFCFADGHVKFVSELIDGGTYAALMSPRSSVLNGTTMAQGIVSGDAF